MSTFYLLPPRRLLGQRLARQLGTLLPGIDSRLIDVSRLADLLDSALAHLPDVYLIYREDLPDGEDAASALKHGFGAEPGDEVIEVRHGDRSDEIVTRRWRVDGPQPLRRAA